MRMPSLLLLTRALDTGGAQRQLVELALGLKRSGWEVTVATFYPGGPLEAPLRTAGVRIISLDKRGRWDVLPFIWRLIKLLRRERPLFA
ncbi:MAG: glycosyltransferase, partial [Burkholderiales bacterium]